MNQSNRISLATLFALAVLMSSLTGCNGSPDSLMQKQIKLMNQLADAHENDASQAKIAGLERRLEANGRKIGELKLTVEEQAELFSRHGEAMMEATTRLLQANMRALPGLFDDQMSR